MDGDRLTDAELDACLERVTVLCEVAERAGHEYSLLTNKKLLRALTEIQERRRAEPALYCMAVDGRLDPECASLSRAVVAAWVDEWNAEPNGHKYELVELYGVAAEVVTDGKM